MPCRLAGHLFYIAQQQHRVVAEVAERLVVSRRTVSTHLSAIYGKLQVNSRSAATRFAIEHGLG